MPTALSPLTIVEIPLDKILPNPDNPAGPVQLEEAQAMAESLKAAGQEAEIRVWALTPEEKQAHPGYEYLLLGGHVRLEGAKLAGWSSLRAVVVERTTPEEEFLAATLDNRRRDPGWWRDDLAIERLLKPTKGKGQAKVAAQLGLSPAKVNESWWITQALTPPAREWVAQNLRSAKTKNKGFLITRKTLLTLADLEDPAVVERALRVVLDDHLGEGPAKKLVEWVKGGNKPGDFPLRQGFGGQVGQKGDKAIPTASKSHPKDPQKSGQQIPPSQTGPIGPAPRDDSQETSKPGPDTTKGQGTSVDTGTQIGAVISGNILWKKIQDAPGRILTGAYPRYIRIFNWVRGWVEKAGIKHKFWATVITMFLLLWAGSTVISVAERFLKWALFRVSWSAKYGKIS
ncbi:MAG TPA: ParB N-terminal domain-containing protein, partial [bacterium]|nr:ParB N-terminal domain-containing protein [bacterium]